MPKINNRKCKIRVRSQKNQDSFEVDCGLINGSRKRRSFTTRTEAVSFAKIIENKIHNEGTAALSLSEEVRISASQANSILAPYGANIKDAAQYYVDHFLKFETAPPASEIAELCIKSAMKNRRRERTVSDLKHRLGVFCETFGSQKLCDITQAEIEEWIHENDDWGPRSKVNYLTKVSQLFNFALKKKWVAINLVESIDRPSLDETIVEIFSIEESMSLIRHAKDFGLTPYISIGLFAGLRSAEILRLQWDGINLENDLIVVAADIAKKRSQRIIPLQPCLKGWLETVPKREGAVVSVEGFRKRMKELRLAAGLKKWKNNGLRHSFGSYHFQRFGDDTKTGKEMGHKGTDLIHNHYKALVTPGEAEKFWKLTPEAVLSK